MVNTGATNHMTDAHGAFFELITSVCRTVYFNDGSVVCIEGCGTIIFISRNGEHCTFSRIYFIPKLKMSILSVEQLDKIGYEVLIGSGLIYIKDVKKKLVAKIPHLQNRLYVLNTTLAQPVCYLARAEEAA
jgi:hypothetical protein